MTVNKVFTDFLEDMVQAQFNSYLYSQKLGEQDNILLPIPFAEIKEITLDLHYAYDTSSPQTNRFQYDVHYLKAQIQSQLAVRLKKLIKQLIDEIEENDRADDGQWPVVKKGIQSETFRDYIKKLYDNCFQKYLLPLIVNSDETQTDLSTKTWTSLLYLFEKEQIEKEVLGHNEVKNWVTHRMQQDALATLYTLQTEQEDHWDILFQNAKKTVPSAINVIIDSEQLKSLPASAIQQAKIVMHMKNLTLET
ncbi:hypothetical protein [Sphingobacterium multivorum]|uniref:hypothetical protein n=1 Tax=Sphingobacterium multivorum TaxID=28454 RepID=UPI0031BA4C4E